MPVTSPKVAFGLFAQEIKSDSTPSVTDKQTFSQIADLKTGNVEWQGYASFEPNYWLLDGNYKFLPPTVHLGWISSSQSDENGDFSAPVVLTITFGSVHSTDSMSINFCHATNDFCTHFKAQFYNSGNALIRSDDYYPDEYTFNTEQAVSDFKKIVLTFYSTNKPYRFLRVRSLDYGTLIVFQGTDIEAGTLTEQVDPISATLPFDTCDVDIYSEDADFNIVNPSGNYANLQNRQPLDIYEIIDGEDVYLGRFFLDTWENSSENRIKFHCVDWIGIIDKIQCLGGIWLSPVLVVTLLESILGGANISYDLDPALSTATIMGWIPAGTIRDALQHICFAIGAAVTCSRSGVLQIFKTILAVDQVDFVSNITNEDKSNGSPLTLKTLITGVNLTTHTYVVNTQSVQLYNGSLAPGTYTIIFTAPAHDLSITGATIVSSGANYAVISVTASGSILLSGQGYTDTTQILNQSIPGLLETIQPNVVSITQATLVNISNGAAVLDLVFRYYQQRYLEKPKLFGSMIQPGKSALVATQYEGKISGVVEKITSDLAMGFVNNAEIVGVIYAA